MNIKYLGQSCFLFEFGGKNILTDPYISDNPIVDDINLADLRVDYILLSHGHSDHMEDLEFIAKNNKATLISTYELVSYFEAKGISGHPMNTGGKWKFDFGIVKLVHAVHSSVLPDGTYGANPVGFVLWNRENCIYFAGDTALTMDMKLIPMTCPKLNFAILPIGDNFTMGFEDAAIASDFIMCDNIIACHYDSVPYIKIDQEKAKSLFRSKGKNIHLLDINKEYNL